MYVLVPLLSRAHVIGAGVPGGMSASSWEMARRLPVVTASSASEIKPDQGWMSARRVLNRRVKLPESDPDLLGEPPCSSPNGRGNSQPTPDHFLRIRDPGQKYAIQRMALIVAALSLGGLIYAASGIHHFFTGLKHRPHYCRFQGCAASGKEETGSMAYIAEFDSVRFGSHDEGAM